MLFHTELLYLLKITDKYKQKIIMKNLKELEQKYLELGKEIEALKKQNTEEEKIAYPIYCKHIYTSLVIKFTELKSGEVIVNNKIYDKGKISSTWSGHTDINIWQQLDVCEKTGFFDGQLIWCWDTINTHSRTVRFYDVKKKRTYMFDGIKGGNCYNNYKPFEGNYPDWALEAFQTLQR